MSSGLWRGLLMAGVLWGNGALAAEVRLTLQPSAGLLAGHVADGTVLVRGQIAGSDGQSGFQVWSRAQSREGSPGRYTLRGRHNGRHQLAIRLAGRGWQPAKDSGSGIILYGTESVASFVIVADGDQSIPADIWQLEIQGGAVK